MKQQAMMRMYRSNSFPKLRESIADDAGVCLAVQYKEPYHCSDCLASPFVVEQTSTPNFIKVGHRSDQLCPKSAVENRNLPAFAYLLSLRQRLPIQKLKYFLNNVRGSS